MRRPLLSLVVVVFTLLGAMPALADTLEMEVKVAAPDLFLDSRGFTHVRLDGFLNTADTGAPALPVKTLSVLVPAGHRVVSVEVQPSELIGLPGTHVVFPMQRPYPLSHQGPIPFTDPNPVFYDGTVLPDLATPQRLQFFRGFGIEMVQVRPVVYDPVAGTLGYHPAMTVVVNTAPEAGLNAQHTRFRGFKRDFDVVASMVHNPEALTGARSGYVQRSDATRAGDHRYVIITSQALAACTGQYTFTTLTNDKNSRGITTLVKSVEDIYSGYTGKDNADKVRNFIKDVHQNDGTDYVLLAGDADMQVVGGETEPVVVPGRYLWGDCGMGNDTVISDLYFGALDGDFDANQNGVYGEQSDNADLVAEVYVGRAPVDNCTEVSNFVRKTLAYQSAAGSYLSNVYFVGEWLFDGYWADQDLELIHHSTNDGLDTKGFSESSFFQVKTLYDDHSAGQNGSWGATEIMAVLNGGNHIINHLGHSNTFYNMRLMTDDIDAGMTNTQPFLTYSQGCYPGAFDNRVGTEDGTTPVQAQDSFAEHLVLGTYGAFATVLNTRFGLGGGYSNSFNRFFWDAVFRAGKTRLGEMQAYSREKMAGYASDPGYLWVYYETTLFGDPELAIHTSASTTDPVIGLPAAPWFLAVQGQGNPAPQTIQIQNNGGGTLNWSVTSDQTWLTVSPASGTAPANITLSASASGKAVGTYTANLTFTAPGATNSPQTLPVTLYVITIPSAVAPYNPNAPTIDGTISSGEYTGATVLDMNPASPNTSFARIMNDGSKLYVAVDMTADPTGDTNDALQLMVDNNDDKLWPTSAGDEGEDVFFCDGSNMYFVSDFNPGSGMQQGQPDWSPAGLVFAANFSGGHWYMEVSIDLASSHLTRSPGQSFGLFMFFYKNTGTSYQVVANWPWALQEVDDCAYFGDVTIGTSQNMVLAHPSSLSFSSQQGGSATATQDLTISATTASPLSYTASPSAGWIKLSKTNGTTADIVKVSADPSGLGTGTHNGSITITAPGATNSPLTVPVTFQVTTPPPEIGVNPGMLSFSAQQNGSLPAAQTASITNLGGGILNWMAAKQGDWFEVSPTGGQAPSTLTVTVTSTNLSVGAHTGAVTLSSGDAQPVQLEVSLNISAPPSLAVDPAAITRADPAAGGSVQVQMQISNNQLGSMSWTLAAGANWITAGQSSGTAINGFPSQITLTLDPTGLSVGLHEADLTVTAPGADHSPATIHVAWTLQEGSAIGVNPASLTFHGTAGGTDPVGQNVSITNRGTGSMDWSQACNQAWMSCSPSNGTAPGSVMVTAALAGLPQGEYNGILTVTSPQAANSPVQVPVKLVVAPGGENQPPTAPVLLSPANGSDITTQNPDLTVQNATDPDGDALTYTFEVYPMGAAQPYAVLSGIASGSGGISSAHLDQTLDNNATYQWRAQAIDSHNAAGPWTDKAVFNVIASSGGGCGCASSGSGGPAVWLGMLLTGLTVLRRSRKRG